MSYIETIYARREGQSWRFWYYFQPKRGQKKRVFLSAQQTLILYLNGKKLVKLDG